MFINPLKMKKYLRVIYVINTLLSYKLNTYITLNISGVLTHYFSYANVLKKY